MRTEIGSVWEFCRPIFQKTGKIRDRYIIKNTSTNRLGNSEILRLTLDIYRCILLLRLELKIGFSTLVVPPSSKFRLVQVLDSIPQEPVDWRAGPDPFQHKSPPSILWLHLHLNLDLPLPLLRPYFVKVVPIRDPHLPHLILHPPYKLHDLRGPVNGWVVTRPPKDILHCLRIPFILTLKQNGHSEFHHTPPVVPPCPSPQNNDPCSPADLVKPPFVVVPSLFSSLFTFSLSLSLQDTRTTIPSLLN